jgi:uncharacterized protein (DUF1778 family)
VLHQNIAIINYKITQGATMKTAHITIRIEPTLQKQIDKAAKDEGRSRGNYITRILEQHFEVKK